MMRAWLLDELSGVETLRLAEAPDPVPGPGEVLLRMRFAALNPADAFLAQGLYPAKPAMPHVLGRDGVGEVIAAGPGVDHVRAGEILGILRSEVGVTKWGTLAEKTIASVASVTPVPPGWSLEEMAGAPLVFLTAWQALTQWNSPPAPPPAGSVLLVTGASGGVGVASVLLGKSMGLKVVALSRSAEKGAKLRELGADFVFAPDDPALVKSIKSAVKAIDIAIDNVGGALFNSVVATLGYGGRISVVGRSGGGVPEFNTASLFFKRNRIGGVSVGDYTPDQSQEAWRKLLGCLDGKRPVVDAVFPSDQVRGAFARLAEGPMGKVLVQW
jgi:NADPH2:quinone reductase